MTDKENEKITKKREPRIVWGTILISLGVIFLVQNLLHIDVLHYFWPLVLIALGIGAILGRR